MFGKRARGAALHGERETKRENWAFRLVACEHAMYSDRQPSRQNAGRDQVNESTGAAVLVCTLRTPIIYMMHATRLLGNMCIYGGRDTPLALCTPLLAAHLFL
jgi:hypothetical protein